MTEIIASVLVLVLAACVALLLATILNIGWRQKMDDDKTFWVVAIERPAGQRVSCTCGRYTSDANGRFTPACGCSRQLTASTLEFLRERHTDEAKAQKQARQYAKDHRVLIFQAKAVVRMPEPPLEVVPLEGA